MTIHIETGNIYLNIDKTNESIYNLFFAQQDLKNKLLKNKISYGGNMKSNICEFLVGVKAEDDDKYDMFTNKTLKFLFYRFNNFLNMENCKMKHLRHMLVVVDQEGLTELQNRNSSYFIEKVNAVSENLNKTEIHENKNKIIKDIIKNYNICRRFYKILFNSVTNNFFEYVSTESYLEVNEINKDFKTIGWGLTPDVREYQGNVELLNSWTFSTI